MSANFADRLLKAIADKQAPICVGIDPIFESLPDAVAGPVNKRNANDLPACVDAVFDFTVNILRIVADYVPIVKFQSAYFEKYLWEGVEAYYSLIQEANSLGLLVIGDVKRGDIGSTASAYAAGHLADVPYECIEPVVIPDAITLNPMMGLDTLQPFVDTAKQFSKGMFVLTRTSNPGSAMFQDVALADGRTWSQMVADSVNTLAVDPALVGESGFSSLGAVVGATQPHVMSDLRKRLPKSIFLLPGYGTQGATGEMTKNAFINGQGAIVSASRSILYAHKEPKYAKAYPDDWKMCVQQAVIDMQKDINSFIKA